jgi:lipoyl(octanoyl) transferase
MTRGFFTELTVYRDLSSRSGAMNMAIDEALLETAKVPLIRFYQWDHPALSFGYFCKFANVHGYEHERDLVRRWTGGGIVLHGDDLTYSIAIPACDPAFKESSRTIYESVHRAICRVLRETGQAATVAGGAGPGINGAGYDNHCFANPVRADVMLNGAKIAGAAQRRTRTALLQQGSIQNIRLGNDFPDRFATALASDCKERRIDELILKKAKALAQQKYQTDLWLQRR